MKLKPPKTEITPDAPFKDALFGREEYATSLTNLLRNISDSLVIFVNAPWGSGKTTFAKMWRAELSRQQIETIYFDAYSADYVEDPFICFSGEIVDLIDKHFDKDNAKISRQKFQESAIVLGKRLGVLALGVSLRAATLGAVDLAHLKEGQDIAVEFAKGASEICAGLIEEKIKNYGEEKDALKSFKDNLRTVAAKIQHKQKFPLTIIVDELDRCRPSFALELLERIKHVFDVDNVVFVLLVNRDQIESYIKTVYGTSDASGFLLKFGALFLDLPKDSPVERLIPVTGTEHFCRMLCVHHDLAAKTQHAVPMAKWVAFFASHFGLTLRQIERVFSVLTLYYGSAPQKVSSTVDNSPVIVALLAVIKIHDNFLYQDMRKGIPSIKGFYERTQLDLTQIKATEININYAKLTLECCLMSDEELEAAIRSEQSSKHHEKRVESLRGDSLLERKQFIPVVCELFDRFKI